MKFLPVLSVLILMLSGCGKENTPGNAGGAGNTGGPGNASGPATERVADCRLATPIVLDADLLKSRITYSEVELDRPIQARGFGKPAKSALKLSFFNISYAASLSSAWTKTGFLGFELQNQETGQVTGFPDVYAGELNVSGITELMDNLKAYTTTDRKEANNLQVITSEGKILSVEIMINNEWNCIRSMSVR
jgi:hypothetical protein